MATSRASRRPPTRAPVPRLSGGRILLVAGLVAVVVLTVIGLGAMFVNDSGGSATVQQTPPQATTETARAAGVVVERPSVDLGDVPLSQQVSHTFTLRNTGDAVVNLGQARTEMLEGC